MTVELIPETVLAGRRLGRHIHHDERSRDYAAETAQTLTDVDHNAIDLPLNQGDIGSCTANALAAALNSGPNQDNPHGVFHEHGARVLYERETELEGAPWPPNDPGGSGLMVCKAAQQLGWITSYQHAFDIQTALLALVQRPVITGVNWYTSFDTPDDNALVAITPDATVRGGHEICADQIILPDSFAPSSDWSTNDDLLDQITIGLWQSWGPGYGDDGRFYWTALTWQQLLAQQGDVTVPIVD